MFLELILYIGWSFVCAFGVRVGATFLLRRWLGDWAQVAAYGVWVACFAIGVAIVGWSGFQMYGFDSKDPAQLIGYVVGFYSPLGVRLLFGAPQVLILDAIGAAYHLADRALKRRPLT